jgi:two-component system, OmpR family, response regulator
MPLPIRRATGSNILPSVVAVPTALTAWRSMERVLLADDDVELVDMLGDYLTQDGFRVLAVHDGETAVAAALSGDYAIAVLDLVMPRVDGLAALKRIRAASNLPVLILTARGDSIDRIVGLEIGADDYVEKPCSPRELSARIRAILRRSHGADSGEEQRAVAVGPIVVWPQRRSASLGGQPLKLTSTEFRLLEALARNAGHPVEKRELAETCLGRALGPYDRSIDTHLSSLRRKLGRMADGRSYIETVYRVGYQLIRD